MIILSLYFITYTCLQIGPDYNRTFAGIDHQSCREECPNQCTNEWKYSDYSGWHLDDSIKISCGKILGCYMILFYDFIIIMIYDHNFDDFYEIHMFTD